MDGTTGAASSCGMFIRMMWWLLGARGQEMDEAFRFNRIIALLLDYAGSAAKDATSRQTVPPDAKKFDPSQFSPEVGDVVYLYRTVSRPGQPDRADQHIFTVIKIVPDATGFTLYSVDGGNDGPGRIDHPNNGIHLAKRHFTTSGAGKPNLLFDGSERPIRSWIKVSEIQSKFTANRIELIRNAAQTGPTQNNVPVVANDTLDPEVGP